MLVRIQKAEYKIKSGRKKCIALAHLCSSAIDTCQEIHFTIFHQSVTVPV